MRIRFPLEIQICSCFLLLTPRNNLLFLRSFFRFQESKWRHIEVGDVVRLKKNDFIPVRINWDRHERGCERSLSAFAHAIGWQPGPGCPQSPLGLSSANENDRSRKWIWIHLMDGSVFTVSHLFNSY